MGAITIETAASAAILLGAGLLYFAWRGRAGRGRRFRGDAPAGWLLVAGGVLGWALAISPGVGTAVAVVLFMCAGLAAISAHSLASEGPGRGERGRVRPEPDGLELGRGYWGRFAVRLGSSLVLAPGLGVLAGLAWFAHGPGGETGRMIGLALVAVAVTAGALVVQLMSPRPWRAAAGLAASSGAVAALVFLPLTAGR